MFNAILRQYKSKDSSGNERWFVILEDGICTTKSRWMMMNFLHTSHIPNRIHVHHKNEVTDDDRIENFELKTMSDHMKHHHPKDYKYGVSWSDDPIAYARIKRNSTPEYKKIYYAYGREFIARHEEETRQYKKEYRARNIEKLKSQERDWYVRNRDRILAKLKLERRAKSVTKSIAKEVL